MHHVLSRNFAMWELTLFVLEMRKLNSREISGSHEVTMQCAVPRIKQGLDSRARTLIMYDVLCYNALMTLWYHHCQPKRDQKDKDQNGGPGGP